MGLLSSSETDGNILRSWNSNGLFVMVNFMVESRYRVDIARSKLVVVVNFDHVVSVRSSTCYRYFRDLTACHREEINT